jgi:hypothetical protein
MDPLKTLCSASPASANSYSEKFSIVSDRNGGLIAIFACPNAIDMADAFVALPGLMRAMDEVDAAVNGALDQMAGPETVDS